MRQAVISSLAGIAAPVAAPGEPNVRVVPQRQFVEQGEVAGKKGGVDTAGEA